MGARQISSFPLFPWCEKSAMHPLYQKEDELSREAIAVAIEVHRHKGPGLIESISGQEQRKKTWFANMVRASGTARSRVLKRM
jgi:hypothetical protein